MVQGVQPCWCQCSPGAGEKVWDNTGFLLIVNSFASVFVQLDRTEKIKNCQDPEFCKKLVVDYYFEKVQKLKFGVYDIDNKSFDLNDDDYLGGIECTLGQVCIDVLSDVQNSSEIGFIMKNEEKICFVKGFDTLEFVNTVFCVRLCCH